MTFSALCESFSLIEHTTLRLEMTRLLAGIFVKLSPEEIEPACWLLLGRLAPLYENVEFNFAEKMMMRALAEFVSDTGKSDSKASHQLGLLGGDDRDLHVETVRKLFKAKGDMGDVAGEVITSSKEDRRSIAEVYAAMREVALDGGGGSQDRKIHKVIELLRASNAMTAKYIVRIMLATLRLGFSDMTMLDALSWTKKGDKSFRKTLELAYQLKADIGKLARAFLLEGEKGLEHFEVELGVPIAPALCQRLKTADEMIEKMGKVIVEPKYDGTRVLIHINKKGKDWQIRTFTRNLEESSGMFPELPRVLDEVHADEVILDSEAVGYDPETDKLLPFQQTIQRKRKHDVAETAERIPLRFFVFDILFKNGENLLQKPLHERKDILKKTVNNGNIFVHAPFIVTEDPKELREFHATQLSHGLEGAVIKQYDSEYQPGRRGFSWVKFKEEEGTIGKLSDTIDCVVMGYYKGQGKRTKFGVGAFLVGVFDITSETYKTIAKIGTGLSDEQWRELWDRCERMTIPNPPKEYIVDEMLRPDVWVRPALVVEIAADEITNSPIHSAEKALRFPRLVKFRDDKKPEQATTMKELNEMGRG